MNITTEFHEGGSGLTIEVDGIHGGQDPEEIAHRVANAVYEMLQTLWIPPAEPRDASAVQVAAAEIAGLP